MSEYKEFLIKNDSCSIASPDFHFPAYNANQPPEWLAKYKTIHVIEYSAYEKLVIANAIARANEVTAGENLYFKNQKLLARVQALREALEKYASVHFAMGADKSVCDWANEALAQDTEKK